MRKIIISTRYKEIIKYIVKSYDNVRCIRNMLETARNFIYAVDSSVITKTVHLKREKIINSLGRVRKYSLREKFLFTLKRFYISQKLTFLNET